MRKILAAALFLVLAAPFAAQAATGGTPSALAMGTAVARALPAPALAARADGLQRTPVTADVAHYRFELPVGPGEHDVIRLHRVVRELLPGVPAPAPDGAFLVHGDAWGFEPTYLGSTSPAVPGPHSLAAFLAQNGIDVWGIDFRFVLVPEEVTDLSFMADWGLGTNVSDLDLALAVARGVRAVTGSGASKLHLVGWSRGGTVGWAQLGEETRRPAPLRHLRGFVAMEHAFKPADPAFVAAECALHEAVRAQIDGGEVVTDFGIVALVGDLARNAPDEPSPLLPSLSNADLAEWLGASAGGGAIPHFHLVGGIVDPATLVTELLYTRPERWFAFLSAVSPYQPLAIDLEGAAISCDRIDSPWDDHLGAISVPVLYVGAAGAFGELGVHTTTLVASDDVSTLLIERAADPAEDWGHEDVLLAEDADTVVWQPILEWIRAR